MPLEKIKEPRICLDTEHNPPTMIVLEPGTYRYTCPSCGKEIVYNVPIVV
ncbi:MAG: hypothetical protein AABY22_00770 [Nanoarchaeota archaeon]